MTQRIFMYRQKRGCRKVRERERERESKRERERERERRNNPVNAQKSAIEWIGKLFYYQGFHCVSGLSNLGGGKSLLPFSQYGSNERHLQKLSATIFHPNPSKPQPFYFFVLKKMPPRRQNNLSSCCRFLSLFFCFAKVISRQGDSVKHDAKTCRGW